MDAANISDFFNLNFIFSARSSQFQAKPHPAIYLEALQKLPKGLPVIAVEGSAKGVEAAASAAVPTVIGCVAFCSPEIRFRQAAQLSQLGAEIVFSLWDDFESVTEEVLASFRVAPTPVPSYGLTGDRKLMRTPSELANATCRQVQSERTKSYHPKICETPHTFE